MIFPDSIKIAVHDSYIRTPPFAFKKDRNKTKFFEDASFIEVLSNKLRFRYEILEPLEDGEYGRVFENGSCSGLIGMVQREEADIAVGKLSYTYKRASVVKFSYPYQYLSTTFITDKPKYSEGDRFALLHPFSSDVWIAMVLSMMLIALFSYFFKTRKFSFQRMLSNIFEILLEKSTNFKEQKFSARILILSWIFGAMILSHSYKAVLLSFLTSPSRTGIRDIAQLSKASERSSFMCSTYRSSSRYSEMLDSGPESWKKISACLIRSNMYTDDLVEFLSPVTYEKAFIGEEQYLKSFQKAFFISDDKFVPDFYGIAIRKSFCCKDALNKAIIEIAAVGLLDKIEKDEQFFDTFSRGYLKSKEQSKYRKLSMQDLSGAFFNLVLGYLLASLVFVLEINLNKNI